MIARIGRAWQSLAPDQRLAAIAAGALLLSMFLPWYQESYLLVARADKVTNSLSAFEVYSFVEGAVFVVTLGVLCLLWARAEQRTFHLPFGDGAVIMAAGIWTMLLIFYRQFDRPDRSAPDGARVDVSVNWGIFIAFLLGGVLAYAGYRIRAAHLPEPTQPPRTPRPRAPRPPRPPDADPDTEPTAVVRHDPDHRTTAVARRPPVDDQPDAQLSFDETAEYRPPPRA